MKKLNLLFQLHSPLLISIFITCAAAVDTIALNQIIKDNGHTIVSAAGNFKLGFFSPGSSKNRYVGIWYNKISPPTVVWVANRETPLNDTTGELSVSRGGLQLRNGNNMVVWSTNSSGSFSLVAQLLDTGNLVLQDQGVFIWQSFDYPRDTLLPGMRIGIDLIERKDTYLTSWNSDDDPSAGPYTLRVDPNGYPQLFETKDPGLPSRFGPWNGVTLNGMPDLGVNSTQFVYNEKEKYYVYNLVNNSLVPRMHLKPDGTIALYQINRSQSLTLISTATNDICAPYSICGPNGVCNISNVPSCKCLDGFEPRRPDEWNIAIWLSGCQRIKPLACGHGVTFVGNAILKFPNTNQSWYKQNMTLDECQAECRKNCSCTAYANSDVRHGGSGCLLWYNDLMDIRVDDEQTQPLYIRMPASELTSRVPSRGEICSNESAKEDADLSSYRLTTIAKSTNNFSLDNKLGEGGFGPVYKGVLEDGQEIAVKRLSETSRQGLDEFKNEVKFIAKLQHRNLVKLLGYCTQGNERMLIYEYMENKSLDSFIFDASGSSMPDWPRLFQIIHGIARGLLYLHHDSRLRIIHRDLKASNILLDKDLNPKISDFGLARSGYIPPEYALHGFFSIKSDVYSFGVLLLEIVSGKKNRGYSEDEYNNTLIGHAWRLYKEGKSLELMNSSLGSSCVESQVLRSIHIGLLCVQHHAEDRPTMSSVVLMLGNENALPSPKEPAFFVEEEMPQLRFVSSVPSVDSVDEVTITRLQAR
ncbi:hypothetical protein QVD17_23421 [Tagetes erecta]|uniref:Receptor-like serine/threonine-protein kinase n=1 Tax=Tagetes erecta TaxID=13708 RepID=A0AAD8KH35_TARER|nr:hypothetical protein QVD17_23421 [Tagetes erecta]